MTKKAKEVILKAIAAVGRKSAEIGCNNASAYFFYQPKEPASLKKVLKDEKKK